MKSIKRSFVWVVFASIVVFGVVVGAICVTSVVRQTDVDTSAIINLTCVNEGDGIDSLLKGVEDAVTNEVSYAQAALMSGGEDALGVANEDGGKSGGGAGSDELHDWLSDTERLFAIIANKTDGAIAYYLRIGELGLEKNHAGFLYVRDGVDDEFVRNDALGAMPGEEQGEEVGWDYDELRAGHGMWIEPLQVDRHSNLMAAYVAPVMHEGKCVGVVGMGVDFSIVIDQVAGIHVYDTGYAFLTDEDGNVMYHPVIPYGTNLSDDDEDVPAVDEAIATGNTDDGLVVYDYGGANKRMAFHVLGNEMRLVLSVSADEIYATRNRMIVVLVIATAVAAAVVVAVGQWVGRRAFVPVDNLTRVAQRVVEGDLEATIVPPKITEVYSLAEAYNTTVGYLRERMKTIDQMAHRDPLTQLQNKSSYDEYTAVLDERIANGEDVRFTIVMLDVNRLKETNDSRGHEAGDDLLIHASTVMSAALPGFGLYRVGGDEFVALAEGDEEHGRVLAAIEDGIERDGVSIACGVAQFKHGEDTSVAEVLVRADSAMYENKRAMKARRDESLPLA